MIAALTDEQQSLQIAQALAADDTRLQAMAAGDLQTLQRVLADSLVYTHATARRESKQEYLHSLRSGRVNYLRVLRDTVRCDAIGGVVLMFGTSTIEAVTQGEPKRLRNVFQSVWAPHEGEWQMVAWTSVLVDSEPMQVEATGVAVLEAP